jgi:hypothetical protein
VSTKRKGNVTEGASALAGADAAAGAAVERFREGVRMTSGAANVGEKASIGSGLGLGGVTALFEQRIEVHRATIGAGTHCGALAQRAQGFEDPHHRLGRFQSAGIDREDNGLVHGNENARVVPGLH